MKKLIFTALLSACCLAATGCFYYPVQNHVLPSSGDNAPDSGRLQSPEGQKLSPSARILEENGTIKTDILNITINSAAFYKTYEGLSPGDSSWRFLVVNITADSRFQNTAVCRLASSEFHLTWDGLDGYMINPEEDTYITDQLPDYENQIRFFKNSSRTGNLIFIVPQSVSGLQLIYEKAALPFSAGEESDPYDSYSDYNGDPYYSNPYYNFPDSGSPDFDIFDFFREYEKYDSGAAAKDFL